MAKFKCVLCEKEQEIHKFITKIKEGKLQYFKSIKDKECIKCDCGGSCKLIEEKGEYSTNIAKFSSLSLKEKQESLKKRSRRHGKKLVDDYKEKERFNG